ncbi:formate dehydrogenase accessory sulfurtransferase FdhD [Gemmatimonas groenlandica]|uniref:Sulfurtransferase FdhD n=1 Tax=Gemmatimonas groenlandica TaxID=2732249 RepID=A0A6M4IQP0_9BACT|nr:formate dehydrogenase accessory sulfurtransferase FdhD [Gemmatimonas groenlandica]QJR37244.1 sulfurtransferase FdhD [Gemmatimonas groenlandica]
MASTNVARAAYEQRAVAVSHAHGDTQGTAQRVTWGIAVEAPVEIALNGTPWTVMLATPADLADLAVGLALTERVLRDAHAVTDVVVSEFLHDISVNIVVPESALDMSAVRARSLLGSTACGLCGLESLAQLHQRGVGVDAERSRADVSDAAILRAFAELPAHQPINAATRSVHAAAWCSVNGEIEVVREDVGRHNALDKLMGALARRGALVQSGFVVMSSRCSYELVYKASIAHTLLLATVSAPTTMALEWSAALQPPLACRVGGHSDGRVVRFPAEDPHGG